MKWKILIVALLSSTAVAQSSGVITATGFGTADVRTAAVPAQAKLMARRAAVVDAQRNLAEQVRGIRLTGGTTMEEYEISNDIVATRVKGLLQGAYEQSQSVVEDENSVTVEVTLAICVDNSEPQCKGRDTLASMKQVIEATQQNK